MDLVGLASKAWQVQVREKNRNNFEIDAKQSSFWFFIVVVYKDKIELNISGKKQETNKQTKRTAEYSGIIDHATAFAL